MKVDSLSPVRLFATPWTVAYQAPLSMARILEWVAISSSWESSQARRIEPTSLMSPALSGRFFTTEPPAAAAAKSPQSCPTLCDPIDGSPPGSPVPGILQARTLEWVVISFSNA